MTHSDLQITKRASGQVDEAHTMREYSN